MKTLLKLRNLGNTLIVVEHDEDTILNADWVVDIGPGAGEYGGEVVFSGPTEKFLQDKKSITAQYLSGAKAIEIPQNYRKPGDKQISIVGAKEHNFKEYFD